ncbi:MAG TPA: RNA 2',3'-cyclic phosphodiesterase [Nitrososphaeraceae archaeon]|nr:RNA 2',3'-cyclic phosphodiesterase [Nitrososphaeraceae archaeon]
MPRVFVAADIYRKNEIQKIQRELLTYLHLENKYLKIVRPENFHFTLVFFGEVDNSILDKIVTKISEIEFQSFEINFGTIGAFPNNNQAKVVWIGLDEKTKDAFSHLSVLVMSKLEDLDLKLEKEIEKEIIPHITLFRTKKVSLSLKLSEVKSNFSIGDKIDTISVKKSMTTLQGPIYENIISVKGK